MIYGKMFFMLGKGVETVFRKNAMPTMFGLLFRAILTSIVIVIAIAALTITFSTYQFVLGEKGASRIDILKQVSESNNVNRTNMQNVMGLIDAEIYPLLLAEESDERIQKKVYEVQEQLARIGLPYTIDIVLNDKRTFSSSEEGEKSLRHLMNTYWYIRHFSGESEKSWNLRFMDPDDIKSYALTYAETIFDRNGKVVGVAILNSTQEALFRTYQKLLKEGDRVYILDENGIIISHSNTNVIGNWHKVMYAFEKQYGYNSYHIESHDDRRYILANYHDEESGWTFVEEHDITEILKNYYRMLALSIFAVILGGAFAGLLGYRYVKRVSRSVTAMADEVSRLDVEQLDSIAVSGEYYEISALSTVFNRMIVRIQDLIRDIRIREQEKRKTEYDFLQAQLSSHFLHNTLIAIKSLIGMGQIEQAGAMMTSFIELLHIPSTSEIQFVTLEEELHLVQSYISVMSCRTDKDVVFEDRVSKRFRNLIVPRMLLQPVVGNSFFHGFAEQEKDCCIAIGASLADGILSITVSDNGEGIAPERLAELERDDYKPGGQHHGVGLRNIRKRLYIIYGGRSNVCIENRENGGAQVTLEIDHYDELPATEEFLRDEEGKNENFSGR